MRMRRCLLGDVIKLQRGHDLPERVRHQGEIPVVTSSGITGYHNEAKAKAPGVVTGRYGTLGEVFYLDQDYWPHNTALYVVDFKGTHPRFASYFLRNVLQNYKSDKAAVPGIDRNVLHGLDVCVPPRSAQESIASILAAYDEAIENNRRRMALLENIARSLYREWFVRLRFPGYEHTPITHGLPQGWERRSIGDVLTFHIGGGWGQEEPQGSETDAGYVIRGTDIPEIESGDFTGVGLRYHNPKSLPHRLLQPGDIIFEISGGGPTQPVGRTLLVTDEVLRALQPAAICASFCKVFRFASPELALFVLRFLRHIRESGELAVYQKESASALKNFNFKAFLSGQVIAVPPFTLLAEFAAVQSLLLTLQHNLALQNQKLRAARDLLLPRLMSGDVEV